MAIVWYQYRFARMSRVRVLSHTATLLGHDQDGFGVRTPDTAGVRSISVVDVRRRSRGGAEVGEGRAPGQ